MKKPDPLIECDLCKGRFKLTADQVKEVPVTLEKEGLPPHEAVLTFLECPLCGKRYIVILDDAKTQAMAQKLRSLAAKVYKLTKAGKPTSTVQKRYREQEWKLGFNRQKLAEEYYGSFYQLEGTTEQLDYRYRTR